MISQVRTVCGTTETKDRPSPSILISMRPSNRVNKPPAGYHWLSYAKGGKVITVGAYAGERSFTDARLLGVWC